MAPELVVAFVKAVKPLGPVKSNSIFGVDVLIKLNWTTCPDVAVKVQSSVRYGVSKVPAVVWPRFREATCGVASQTVRS